MGKINAVWHNKNKIPKNSKVEDRIKWHKEHLLNCTCRIGVPKSLKEYFNI